MKHHVIHTVKKRFKTWIAAKARVNHINYDYVASVFGAETVDSCYVKDWTSDVKMLRADLRYTA